MKRYITFCFIFFVSSCWIWVACSESQQGKGNQIVHDAEHYILEAQNGAGPGPALDLLELKVWAVEDGKLDKKLAELRKKYGAPPNIIHYMWDDQTVMSFGDPIYQKIRGYETPQLNKLANEGILFARMYTERGGNDSTACHPDGYLGDWLSH